MEINVICYFKSMQNEIENNQFNDIFLLKLLVNLIFLNEQNWIKSIFWFLN